MRGRGLSASLTMLGLAACQTPVPGAPGAARPSVVVEEAEAWRQVASPRDSALLDGLPARWGTALAAARAAGLSKRLDAERTLLLPSARLARAAPAPGPYRCRSIRLGERRWTASAPAYCFVGVEQGQLTLATEIKGLHVGGYLWELKEGDGLVFLGALAPGAGKAAAAYGESPASDSAGFVERLGDFRYRLVLPASAPGILTIVEMVAAPRA